MIKEKGKEICQRVLDTNIDNVKFENYYRIKYNDGILTMSIYDFLLNENSLEL